MLQRCEAITALGETCRYTAMRGQIYCEMHTKEGPKCKGMTKLKKQCTCKPMIGGYCIAHYSLENSLMHSRKVVRGLTHGE